jgi:hypothetical protein
LFIAKALSILIKLLDILSFRAKGFYCIHAFVTSSFTYYVTFLSNSAIIYFSNGPAGLVSEKITIKTKVVMSKPKKTTQFLNLLILPLLLEPLSAQGKTDLMNYNDIDSSFIFKFGSRTELRSLFGGGHFFELKSVFSKSVMTGRIVLPTYDNSCDEFFVLLFAL